MTDPHQGGPAQDGGPAEPAPRPGGDDTSGVDDLLEEGGPVEPQDEAEAEVPSIEEPAPDDGEELAAAKQAVADRTADLQRLQAEYINYKRRVDRDRELVRQNATYSVLTPMLDVLDDIERARQAGELEGGFKGVAEKLERVVAGLGLIRFGDEGDAFDPTMHEALSNLGPDPDVTQTTCKHVAKVGYRIGERVVRAAQVLVVEPVAGDPTAGTSDQEPG